MCIRDSPQIKDVTMLAVIEKAMQNDPVEYCGQFLHDNKQTADTLSALAVEMARSWFESDDQAELVMQSTLLSSVMFMTYEMVKAEVEAKELEELYGWRPSPRGVCKKKAGRFSLVETEYH